MKKSVSKEANSKASTQVVTYNIRGLGDIMGDEYYKIQGLYEKAQEVAMYYGFRPIETRPIEQIDLVSQTRNKNCLAYEKTLFQLKGKSQEKLTLRPDMAISCMRAYLEHEMMTLPQPVMLYSTGNIYSLTLPDERQTKVFDIQSIGGEKAITDALVIRTITTILEEYGDREIIVRLNSLGDRDGKATLIKDINSYYKKHFNSICKNCQELYKTSPTSLLTCKDPNCERLKDSAPSYIQHLTQDARLHLKQVASYLDEMGVPFELKHSYIPDEYFYTRTVFEIEAEMENGNFEVVARGGRYNNLAKDVGWKKEIPVVGGSIFLERILRMKDVKELAPRIMKSPKIYFIQIGQDAKLKSLCVMEVLRKAKVPLYQSLSKDSLTEQMSIAEKMKIPYCMIFGQKEAMDNTVIIRNMDTHSQDTVKIDALPEYLKNLK